MKNNNLFIMMAAVFALISCGTANRTAYNSGTQFRNSIYYTPDSKTSQTYLQEQEYLQNLQERTTSTAAQQQERYTTYIPSTDSKTIYVGENNQVNIDARPGTTYTIVDDQESYEARLRKFDSPYYSINIDIYDPYPWWSYGYGWYYPYAGRWHSSWYHPWYSHYGWHTPSWNLRWNWHYNWGWHNPWYGGSYWGWYDPFYDPWWGPSYWPGYWPGYWPSHRPGFHPGHHHPGHHPGAGPGARPDHRRDVYYGKRNSSPTYREVGRNNSVSNSVAGRPNTGSVTRRPANVTQINNGTRNPGHNVATQQNSGRPQNNAAAAQPGNNQYRRVAPSSTKSSQNNNGKGVTTNRKENSATVNYSRGNSSQNSSSYNRNSSSQNRSSFSSGNSSSGMNRSSGSSNSGGSSYRRR